MSEPREFAASDTPLVLMFRPTHYEVVSDDRVAEWEALLAERVGLKADVQGLGSGLRSECWCDRGGKDDCDWVMGESPDV